MKTSKILYKYLPIGRLTYLQNELLRFTQPADLNDPFECYPRKIDEQKLFATLEDKIFPLTVADKNPSEKDKVREQIKSIVADFLPKAYSKTNELVGIFSLSKNWNNSLMWAHYTNSHTGFCVGFDYSHEFFKDYLDESNDVSQHTNDVEYGNKRAEIKVDFPYERPGLDIFLIKSKDWEYEEEVRVIKTLNQSNTQRDNDNGLKIHLFKVPHNAIKEIIIGARIDEKKKDTIVEFCKKYDVELYQSIISDITFDMEREKITVANDVYKK